MRDWVTAKLSSCFKKSRYRTESKAEQYRQKRLADQPNLRIYHCSLCQGWHLTKRSVSV